MQGLVTPQDHMSGGKRRRRGDSPGAWRKRRGDDMDGHMDAPPPPKQSANNKVLTRPPSSHHPSIAKKLCECKAQFMGQCQGHKHLIKAHGLSSQESRALSEIAVLAQLADVNAMCLC